MEPRIATGRARGFTLAGVIVIMTLVVIIIAVVTITQRSDWEEVRATNDTARIDVKSTAPGNGLDGTPYHDW